MMVIIDGQAVTEVKRVIWLADDDRRIRGAVVIGRAKIRLEGREDRDALLVAATDTYKWFAILFEPWTARLVAIEVPR